MLLPIPAKPIGGEAVVDRPWLARLLACAFITHAAPFVVRRIAIKHDRGNKLRTSVREGRRIEDFV